MFQFFTHAGGAARLHCPLQSPLPHTMHGNSPTLFLAHIMFPQPLLVRYTRLPSELMVTDTVTNASCGVVVATDSCVADNCSLHIA